MQQRGGADRALADSWSRDNLTILGLVVDLELIAAQGHA
jgi:hypothetical protein